jgi:hypothetical protein
VQNTKYSSSSSEDASTTGGLCYLPGCDKKPGIKREGPGMLFSALSLESFTSVCCHLLVAAPMVALILTLLTGASSSSFERSKSTKGRRLRL